MDEILRAISDTPIPTILVIAGLAFILLAFAGRLIGRIEVPPEKQKWTGISGGIILVIGIGLSVVPISGGGGTPISTPLPATPVPTNTPVPATPVPPPTATPELTSTPVPTATPVPPTKATSVPTPTPTPSGPSNEPRWTGRSFNINPDENMGQSFKPISSKLLTIEVAVLAVEDGIGGVGGDTLTMTLFSESGNVLAEISRPVLGGFDGWLRFKIPDGGIDVTPGRTLILNLHDTGKSIFEWKYAENTYPDGTLIFSNTLSPSRDTFFRVNHR